MEKHETSYPRIQKQDIANEKKAQVVHKPQWSALLELLSKRLDKAAIAVRDSGREMTPEEHNAYYRAIFDEVRGEAASRDDIPNAIMEKPVKELTLTFYGRWNDPVCLGCLDFNDTNDTIHVEIHAKEGEPDGVTKDDLIRRICEVIYGGLHVYREPNKEVGIILSNFDWMGTAKICNLVDSILYIGYKPVTEASSVKGEKDGLGGRGDVLKEKYEVTWDPKALGHGASAYQGYDDDYTEKLMALKGWDPEDWNLAMTF
ncbi:uncharacterized protein F4807DRAFT_461729 [Annulohypoxylon truncatum]|uniref:uncharacterized protein n=1 Tax=Annulohypoxylon truncatum TaxID=327061 RepID=UPI0020076EE9|nr:uncharacterized protein F4807DRAFT_461729 [Annulohypoxylon truncatum]KAI1208401.1 hypothetical protein F4807DRAFT_461729 [Annulohypoxylon truncatum]